MGTHSYVTLEVSRRSFDEVKSKLVTANYHQALIDEQTIDMHGLALIPQAWTEPEDTYLYKVGSFIVADGNETEGCEVKGRFAIEGEQGHERGYVVDRLDDGFRLVIMEEEARDYTVVE